MNNCQNIPLPINRSIDSIDNIITNFSENTLKLNNNQITQLLQINKMLFGKLKNIIQLGSNKWEIIDLKFSNMLSYGQCNNLIFQNVKGSTIITGKNYSGKSNLIDIILFSIYGKCSRSEINNDLLNIYKNNLFSIVTIKLNDKTYKILRYAKKSSKYNKSIKFVINTYLFEKINNNFIQINLSNDDVKNKITELFGDYNDAIMTNVMLQNTVNFTDLTTVEKYDYLIKICDLTIFDELHKLSAKHLSNLKNNLKNINNDLNNTDIDKLKHSYDISIFKLQELKQQKNILLNQSINKHTSTKNNKYCFHVCNTLNNIIEKNTSYLNDSIKSINDQFIEITKNKEIHSTLSVNQLIDKLNKLYDHINCSKLILLELYEQSNNIKSDDLPNNNLFVEQLSQIDNLIEKYTVQSIQFEQSIKSYHDKLDKQKVCQNDIVYWTLYNNIMSRRGISLTYLNKILVDLQNNVNSVLEPIIDFKTSITQINNVNINDTAHAPHIIINKTQNNITLPINKSSGSQLFIFNLAVRIALSKIGKLNQPNFFIIDESIYCLDKHKLDNITNIFNTLDKYFDFTLVISHMENIIQKCNNVIAINMNHSLESSIVSTIIGTSDEFYNNVVLLENIINKKIIPIDKNITANKNNNKIDNGNPKKHNLKYKKCRFFVNTENN